MTVEEFFANPDVRRTLAYAYWCGRLHGQLGPGLVGIASFEAAAVAESTAAGNLGKLYDRMVAESSRPVAEAA